MVFGVMGVDRFSGSGCGVLGLRVKIAMVASLYPQIGVYGSKVRVLRL